MSLGHILKVAPRQEAFVSASRELERPPVHSFCMDDDGAGLQAGALGHSGEDGGPVATVGGACL